MLFQSTAASEPGLRSLKCEPLLPAEKTESPSPAKGQESFPAAVATLWTKILDPLNSASLVLARGANGGLSSSQALSLGVVRWAKESRKNNIRALKSKEQNK